MFLKSHPAPFKPSAPVKAIRPKAEDSDWEFPPEGYWILGKNDELETCAMTALANHLLLTRRRRCTIEEITEPGEALSVDDAMMIGKTKGLAGWTITEHFPTEPDPMAVLMPGNILELGTPYGPHAAVTMGGGLVITWGRILRVKAPLTVTGAWALTWENNWEREQKENLTWPVAARFSTA